MTIDDELNGWHPDPFGRFEERYFVYGEPSHLVRADGIETRDPPGMTPSVSGVQSPLETDAVTAETRRPFPMADREADRSSSAGGQQNAPAQFTSMTPQRSKVHTMRITWAVLAALCAIGTIVFLNINSTGTSTSLDGSTTTTLDCGSVISPQVTVTAGSGFFNDDALCAAQHHSPEVTAIILGVLAVVGMLLAGMTMIAGTTMIREEDLKSKDEDYERQPFWSAVKQMTSDSIHNRTYDPSGRSRLDVEPALPGWYPDPDRGDFFRYWNGRTWTAKTAREEPPVPPPPSPPERPWTWPV
jgi:hypothetical protein